MKETRHAVRTRKAIAPEMKGDGQSQGPGV